VRDDAAADQSASATYPAPPIKLSGGIDARRAVDVWLRLIRDEELYRQFTLGRHGELSTQLGLSQEDVTILDEFRLRPGTRWNIDNIRFRATEHVSTKVRLWLPLTVHVLTGGNQDWVNDLVFEYLTHHGWNDLGPYQLTECERFIQFVRDRVLLRRTWNPLIDPVLAFELAVVQLLKKTRDVPADSWPVLAGRPSQELLASMRPRPGPVSRLLELPIDLTPWLESQDPTGLSPGDEPTQYLIYIPSLKHPHRVQTIGDGARVVFESCDGLRTGAEIVAALATEYDIDPDATSALLGRWIEAGALCA
jgi:hypothetical protein